MRSVGKAQATGTQAPEMTVVTGRRIRLASPTTALVLGGLVLALIIADVPLAGLARQGLNASGGSLPVWVSAPFAVVGFVLAWRKPGNPLGWIILGTAVLIALSEDASYYTVADYRLRHGGLPLGWVALLAQPGWAPGIVLFGLTVLLFPDGRPAVTAAAVGGVGLCRDGRAVDSQAPPLSRWVPSSATTPRWIPPGTCCCLAMASKPPSGGNYCRTCSWCSGWSAGWCRSLPRCSVTGARPGTAASS